jgi:hypothetical protein
MQSCRPIFLRSGGKDFAEGLAVKILRILGDGNFNTGFHFSRRMVFHNPVQI